MTIYIVNVVPKNRSYGDLGFDYTIEAKNKKEAVSKARRYMARDMHYDRLDGALVYTAVDEREHYGNKQAGYEAELNWHK